MREMHTRYGKENIGPLWLIIEPILLASMIGLLHARGGRLHTGDMLAGADVDHRLLQLHGVPQHLQPG